MKIVLIIFLFMALSITVMAKQDVPKEFYEWTNIWREGSDKTDKPHILLIGDSICDQNYGYIREKVGDKFYVDRITTSRAIDQDYFWKQLDMVLSDEDYEIICYNFGLHGGHISLADYEKGMKKMADIMKKTKAKIIYVSTSPVEPNSEENNNINKLTQEKNKICQQIAKDYKFTYCDIYNPAIEAEGMHNENDTIHFSEKGKKLLSEIISKTILEVYEK
ncbi:MAG: SGNH/GDSL hydrolase family protein [Abditibacteriota bacterium]|nr:SGNH/GDSL hydrolase family protein [Abditibacteriota bacterium]